MAQNPALPFSWQNKNTVIPDHVQFMHFPVAEIERPDRSPTRILARIREARDSVDIITPYFVPPKEFEGAMVDAIKRGVKVRVLTNSAATNNQKLAQLYYEANFARFAKMGLELWEYRGPETLHAKIMRIDGNVSVVGSLNGDAISFRKNTESGLLVSSQPFAQILDKSLTDSFFANADKVAENGLAIVNKASCNVIKRIGITLLKNHL